MKKLNKINFMLLILDPGARKDKETDGRDY